MLTRRVLLKYGSAILTLPTLLSSSARAQSSFSNWAVTFDGNSYLSNPGAALGLPTTSPYGLLVYSYKTGSVDKDVVLAGVLGAGSNALGGALQIWHASNGIELPYHVQLAITIPSGGSVATPFLANAPIPYIDNKWHTALIAWDATVPKAIFIIDGQQLTTTYVYTTTNGVVAYNGNQVAIGNTLSTSYPVSDYMGDLADLMLYIPPTYIDPTPATFVDNFYDVESGFAVRQASTGSGPGNGLWLPQIFLTGGSKLFPMNLANSSGQFNWPDNYLGNSFSVTGTLTTANSDPFAPNSPY